VQTWIAFFRGVNVGGNNPMPMKTLVVCLGKIGCVDAKTYIQSGNAVFRSKVTDAARMSAQVGKAVAATFGFEPRVLLLTVAELEKAAAANPFPQAAVEPKSLHLFFLGEKPKKPDLEGLAQLKADHEAFELKGKVFYLYTPRGFGISKLAERVDKKLGVEAVTARNLRTVTTVLEMAKALG
jgi:uncharacterized protein (DUF1697 family)